MRWMRDSNPHVVRHSIFKTAPATQQAFGLIHRLFAEGRGLDPQTIWSTQFSKLVHTLYDLPSDKLLLSDMLARSFIKLI